MAKSGNMNMYAIIKRDL